MKFAEWVIAGVLVLRMFSAAQEPEPTLSDFTWLSGCWQSSTPSRDYMEQWMKPAGGIMMGMSLTLVDGKVREYEYLRIIQEDDGKLYYVAVPSGQKEVKFELVRWRRREAVFSNPDHDFPQRIIYLLQDDGSLLARIEGVSKGKERGVDFPMKRTVCEHQ